MISLTRRYHFSASHRLHAAELSPAENARLFGKCNNPHGHGHDYVLEVTVTGEADPVTGLILPIGQLDKLVDQRVLRAFASRNINLDVPQFRHLTATTENVSLVIAQLLEQHWREFLSGTSARLSRVYIQETERNGFEVLVDNPGSRSPRSLELEGIVHA
jgi:6-pyruvoyltetrahydropterin/6-carboxytetrahydropterin synthase